MNRRDFIASGAAGTLGLAPVLRMLGQRGGRTDRGPSSHVTALDGGWMFSICRGESPDRPELDPATAEPVTLPHCVSPLSWEKWDPASWQKIWLYQRVLKRVPELDGLRLWLHFDRIMAAATLIVNGHALPKHVGGFLPFEYEITNLATKETNSLSVIVDSQWSNVPPAGSPQGPSSIDYLLPGGICGSVELRAVPQIFIKDVFAKPVNVLGPDRRLNITCLIDCGVSLPAGIRLTATLRHGDQVIDTSSQAVALTQAQQDVSMNLNQLKNVMLWDVDHPTLYDLSVTLSSAGSPLHTYKTRVGFRDARFERDGFFLNGKRLQLFGLNRHELYPYVGFAALPRAQRYDAEYLRRQLNCNVVRCSHYPQSEAFLDACDELGLLVWEEIPGWQYLGDAAWRDVALSNVADMVRRDRNHPSIVVWGVRINESANDPELYRQTSQIAKSLDDSRPVSGTMTPSSTKDWKEHWQEDVFAFDDYHAEPDGTVGINEPLPDMPYLIAETVGQYSYGTAKNFSRRYRRVGNAAEQSQQALLHAQAHSRAAAYPRCSGVIAWCAFDYASLINAYNNVKCPGVADIFRIPKLGAAFYLAQVDPSVRPVIEPDFYWDFGVRSPTGPGAHAAIFSNCDHLAVMVDGKLHGRIWPDRQAFPHIKFPPSFIDLSFPGGQNPELRIDGYVGGKLLLSRSFSSDRSADQLWLKADDPEFEADGSDAVRVVFAAADKFGVPRSSAQGELKFDVTGPGLIVGDNPFRLDDSGGVGAVWVKSLPDRAGLITLTATHDVLGKTSVSVHSKVAR